MDEPSTAACAVEGWPNRPLAEQQERQGLKLLTMVGWHWQCSISILADQMSPSLLAASGAHVWRAASAI